MSAVSFVVADGDWGKSTRRDVFMVARSVVQSFPEATEQAAVAPLLVEPTVGPDHGPITLVERSSAGQVRIRVDGRDCFWARLAFQFAHEFCHVLSNFRAEPCPYPWQWVDEALCETASLFALLRMAESWKTSPPYPQWADYARALETYAQKRLHDADSVLAGAAFAPWLASRLGALGADPYLREDNKVIARTLLPLLQAEPDAWRAVRYLNQWASAGVSTLADYFSAWRSATPEPLQPLVEAIHVRLT